MNQLNPARLQIKLFFFFFFYLFVFFGGVVDFLFYFYEIYFKKVKSEYLKVLNLWTSHDNSINANFRKSKSLKQRLIGTLHFYIYLCTYNFTEGMNSLYPET